MLTPEQLANMRRDYAGEPLDESLVAQNPFDQFDRWFDAAVKADCPDANAMALSTATRDATPSVRMVLIKGVDASGLVFYTHTDSRKGTELAQNPKAMSLFYWAPLCRQVHIEGTITPVTAAEADEYFHSRPYDSQVAGMVSHQTRPLKNRAELETTFADAMTRYEGKTVPRPETWSGYRLTPTRFEFWQGRESRLHDRIEYRLEKGSWIIRRLYP